MIDPVTALPWMNDVGILVAPAATSLALLSKSNSTSSPTAFFAAAVTELAPDVAVAVYEPAARSLPSTEIFERSALFSHRTRTLAASAVTNIPRSKSHARCHCSTHLAPH